MTGYRAAMCPPGLPSGDASEAAEVVRHRRVPMRVLRGETIVARPRDGAPVVMASTAALVWQQLDGWTTPRAIDRLLAAAFPEVAGDERVAARTEILKMLRDEDLLERG